MFSGAGVRFGAGAGAQASPCPHAIRFIQFLSWLRRERHSLTEIPAPVLSWPGVALPSLLNWASVFFGVGGGRSPLCICAFCAASALYCLVSVNFFIKGIFSECPQTCFVSHAFISPKSSNGGVCVHSALRYERLLICRSRDSPRAAALPSQGQPAEYFFGSGGRACHGLTVFPPPVLSWPGELVSYHFSGAPSGRGRCTRRPPRRSRPCHCGLCACAFRGLFFTHLWISFR